MSCPKCESENVEKVENLVELTEDQKKLNDKNPRFGCWDCGCEFTEN